MMAAGLEAGCDKTPAAVKYQLVSVFFALVVCLFLAIDLHENTNVCESGRRNRCSHPRE